MEDLISLMMPFLTVTVVIGGAYLATRWMAKSHGNQSSGRNIQVLERVMLAKDTCLALIRVGSRIYLASVAVGKVELIREMEKHELPEAAVKKPGGDFLGLLTKAVSKSRQQEGHSENGNEQDGAQS